jgi:hypothetical protein
LQTTDLYHLSDIPPATKAGPLHPADYIYSKQDAYASPVVIESHKLVFFIVPGAGEGTLIQLFRRMMGSKDWKSTTSIDQSGLKRLYDYNLTEANRIMTAPDYTRAIMVRDPKERLMSVYVHKAREKDEVIRRNCCGDNEKCVSRLTSFSALAKEALQACDVPDWRPQGKRMEPKYYRTLNFVGQFENASEDLQRLLERIGAWQLYGKTGWGSKGKDSIYFPIPTLKQVGPRPRRTRFSNNMTVPLQIYMNYDLERLVEKFYESDYANGVLNLTMKVTATHRKKLDSTITGKKSGSGQQPSFARSE